MTSKKKKLDTEKKNKKTEIEKTEIEKIEKKKKNYILRYLQKRYPDPKPPLDFVNHYTLLVAVLLSAQCTDKRVNIVTKELFAKATSPEEMLKLTPKKIQKIIRPCGLSEFKANAIYNLSKIIIEKYNGEVPQKMAELEELPGVGHKTASVVVSQGFGQDAFPVDTHIHRLAARWQLSSGKNIAQTEKDLKEKFPQKKWNALHLQIIFYGREFCMARGHEVEKCPICLKLSKMEK